MELRLLPLPSVKVPREHILLSSSGLPSPPPCPYAFRSLPPRFPAELLLPLQLQHRRSRPTLFSVWKKEVQVSEGEGQELQQEQEASPDDLEYIGQVKRVLGLLKKNRDMTFGEVEATKKRPGKSLYARATDTGVDP